MKPNANAPRYTNQGYGPVDAPGWISVSRGAALGLACIISLNLLEVFAFNTSAIHNWLCDFRMVPQPLCVVVLSMLATAFVLFSIRPVMPGSVRVVTIALVTLVAMFVAWDLWDTMQQVPESLRSTAMSRSMGTIMLFAVAGAGILAGPSSAASGMLSIFTISVSSVLSILGFIVVTLQTESIGDPMPADPAPAVHVLGCAVAADGTPSQELSDRVTTGCRLYLEGHGKLLILSGAADNGSADSTAVMKQLALNAGVPESALRLDPASATVAQAVQFAAEQPELRRDQRIILVTHWYQLARIRMVGRQTGMRIIGVPAEQRGPLTDLNRRYIKEVNAFLNTCFGPAKKLVHRTADH